MSQCNSINYKQIIQQQQEQLAALQAQLQALQVRGGEGEVSTEVARPQIFDRALSKISGFIMVCRLYIRMKMWKTVVEEHIQWVLLYMQGGLADIWKENTLEDLKRGLLEYENIGEFLADIKKEFERGDEESAKVAELRKLEQGSKMIEEFVQEFRRVARGSGYERRPLVEEFKRGINAIIC